ncbi:SDR family oxidoreductase [Phenylobacterium sp.]|nr:SDR family oxidoreductase [Phenylobacterium sp.]MCA6287548.1 SDR family oxidoreductase [Phenylobacterium sp.]MCA6289473.1 SDR family oxidoreductase [Phenylobacterium sp.]MCA6310084.1 SDR family oxidoreductase [Phenylobacterium sp.]MCA6324393.1 SDR family oxidoreductase [Phenylobacterium sp.]MCA6336894.1 SDR family oxidoreductase [Phenylobacterium sp.]
MSARGTALVTGGPRRIGRELVRACSAAGYDVAIHCRREDEDAREALSEVRETGRSGGLFTCDLSDEGEVTGLVRRVIDSLGPVTLLVNSASLFRNDAFAEAERASWDEHLNINLRAPLVLSREMAAQGLAGHIVHILDQRVLAPGPDYFSYTLSKAALWSATRMMAIELAPRIRVNAIGPGPVLANPDQSPADFDAEAASTPLGRAVDPADIGRALTYLIGAASVTGQMIAVDGGQHLD